MTLTRVESGTVASQNDSATPIRSRAESLDELRQTLSGLPAEERASYLVANSGRTNLTPLEQVELERSVLDTSDGGAPTLTGAIGNGGDKQPDRVEIAGAATGKKTLDRLETGPKKQFSDAKFDAWYDRQQLGSSDIALFTGGNGPDGSLNRLKLSDKEALRAYAREHQEAFVKGFEITLMSTSWKSLLAADGKPDPDAARAFVEQFRKFGLMLDTEALNKALKKEFGDDAKGRAAFEGFLISNRIISLQQAGEMALLNDRSLGGQAYGVVHEGSVYLIDTVFGLGSLAVGAAKVAYDSNPAGLVADGLRGLGVEVPDWAPSTLRNGERALALTSSLIDVAGRIADDPGVLIERHRELWTEGRYGALAARSTLDIIAIVTTLRSVAGVARTAAEVGGPAATTLSVEAFKRMPGMTPAKLEALAVRAETLAARLSDKVPTAIQRSAEKALGMTPENPGKILASMQRQADEVIAALKSGKLGIEDANALRTSLTDMRAALRVAQASDPGVRRLADKIATFERTDPAARIVKAAGETRIAVVDKPVPTEAPTVSLSQRGEQVLERLNSTNGRIRTMTERGELNVIADNAVRRQTMAEATAGFKSSELDEAAKALFAPSRFEPPKGRPQGHLSEVIQTKLDPGFADRSKVTIGAVLGDEGFDTIQFAMRQNEPTTLTSYKLVGTERQAIMANVADNAAKLDRSNLENFVRVTGKDGIDIAARELAASTYVKPGQNLAEVQAAIKRGLSEPTGPFRREIHVVTGQSLDEALTSILPENFKTLPNGNIEVRWADFAKHNMAGRMQELPALRNIDAVRITPSRDAGSVIELNLKAGAETLEINVSKAP